MGVGLYQRSNSCWANIKETFLLFPSFFRTLESMVQTVVHFSQTVAEVRGSFDLWKSLKNGVSFKLRMSCSLFSPLLFVEPTATGNTDPTSPNTTNKQQILRNYSYPHWRGITPSPKPTGELFPQEFPFSGRGQSKYMVLLPALQKETVLFISAN